MQRQIKGIRKSPLGIGGSILLKRPFAYTSGNVARLLRRQYLHLHEATMGANALDTDLCAGVRVDHASKGVQRVPVLIIVVEYRDSWLAGVIGRLTIPVQGDRLGRLKTERRIVGLDAVGPDATDGVVHYLGMSIDR